MPFNEDQRYELESIARQAAAIDGEILDMERQVRAQLDVSGELVEDAVTRFVQEHHDVEMLERELEAIASQSPPKQAAKS